MIVQLPGTTEWIDPQAVTNWYFRKNGNQEYPYGIEFFFTNSKSTAINFKTEEARQAVVDFVREHHYGKGTPTKGYGMKDLIGDLRGYLKDNRDLLFTIGLVVLLDHILFEGAFRERLKSLVEGFLTKTENKLKVIDVTPKA